MPATSWSLLYDQTSIVSSFSPRDTNLKLVAWNVGFVTFLLQKPPSTALLLMFSFLINENHYVFSWEVWKSLYEYTVCKHINLTICKKVDKFWSTFGSWLWNLLIIPYIKDVPFQKASFYLYFTIRIYAFDWFGV